MITEHTNYLAIEFAELHNGFCHFSGEENYR